MTDSLLNKLEELKKLLDNDQRILILNKLDEELSNNEEVMRLSYKKDMASIEFDDALKHFSESSNEVKQAQKKLYNAKLELDSHPLVRKYNKAYIDVKDLYSLINKEIFGDFAV